VEPACPKNQYVHDNVASDTITLCEWCNQSTYSRPWSESNGCLTCTSNLYDSDFDEQCMSLVYTQTTHIRSVKRVGCIT
jgi:hypothetical protein